MLVLKLTDSNRRAYGGFQWPESGPVECLDWDPKPECGGGLHGWARGEGDYRHSFNEGVWLVVDVPDDETVSLGDKVKFRRGRVVFCGTRTDAVEYLKFRGVLTEKSNPALACFTIPQLVELAMRAADRAIRQYAPQQLRARGLVELAERLERLPRVVDRTTAANAAANAATASTAAYTYDAAYAAANAATASTAASADAAYAAANAATAADYAANAATCAAEREEQRLDKLELLGFKVRS